MLKTLNSTYTCSLIRASDYSIESAQCTCPPQELDGQRRRLTAALAHHCVHLSANDQLPRRGLAQRTQERPREPKNDRTCATLLSWPLTPGTSCALAAAAAARLRSRRARGAPWAHRGSVLCTWGRIGPATSITGTPTWHAK